MFIGQGTSAVQVAHVTVTVIGRAGMQRLFCPACAHSLLILGKHPGTHRVPCRLLAGGVSSTVMLVVDEAMRLYERRSLAEEVLLAAASAALLVSRPCQGTAMAFLNRNIWLCSHVAGVSLQHNPMDSDGA